MNEIKRFDFEGRTLDFQKINGDWWARADEAAPLLGHKDGRKVLNLFGRHREHFKATETCILSLRTEGDQARDVRLFSPRGLSRLCLLGRTAVSLRLHDWVLDVLEQLRTGEAAILTREQVAQIVEATATKVRAETAAYVTQLMTVIEGQQATIRALSGAIATQASSAGKLLSRIAHDLALKDALDDARNPTGDLFPGLRDRMPPTTLAPN